MQGAGGGRATMSYLQHCLSATDALKNERLKKFMLENVSTVNAFKS
jgi:tartrate dehydratase alpha subunit/fumarate hydratase class I-like protein